LNPSERIRAKLASCRPYYEHLAELRAEVLGGADDWRTWALVERHLHLVLECAIDVGEMAIAAQGGPRPEENRDVFRILGDRKVLPTDLAVRLVRAAGLRNLLVHQYGTLDREKVRAALVDGLPDLDDFARRIEEHLRTTTPP